MVNCTIDGRAVQVPERTTILNAAAAAGIHIPTLCYLKDINEIAACRVCVVEVEGYERLMTACNNTVAEGMVVYTNSRKARLARRANVELILSQHDTNCAICVRSGNCELQKVANDLNILSIPFEKQLPKKPSCPRACGRPGPPPSPCTTTTTSASSACAAYRSVIRCRTAISGMSSTPAPRVPSM